ncbi:YeeE/YedE thiosulfate transporter family protein [Salinimicrobium sp. MT39]|uniref:YeeE/YedE thiosulfate transporter family protein n=1 Tax=Salinimicrobium profundisediminis TaxID=2994553 RepID=A0A9X3I2R7_9FLAO|nr:DUF6691 family protein [Salinimicrobium profundisediminis]MCX2839227.1 YeeE/YedE thiosulfate transporter family protein [Salinimicrobium profundisediminis]
MRRTVGYILIGIFFGIVMYKSEAASWFRIYEMFRFDSFHMYGIIGSALILGIIGVQIIKRKNLRSFFGDPIKIASKERGFKKYFFGGIIFGLGWALAGACPGPIYTLIGAGYVSVIVVLLGAVGGAFLYGLLRKKLPH